MKIAEIEALLGRFVPKKWKFATRDNCTVTATGNDST